MATLEQLTPGALVDGLVPGKTVSIVSAQPHGSNSTTVVYRNDTGGALGEQLLFRSDENRLRIAETGRLWVFDGDGAEAAAIDAQNLRFARAGVALSVARTIFLGSVPGKATQGIEDTRIRLGAVRPGESVSTYNDALGKLMQRLQFLPIGCPGKLVAI